jgi:signal transduction histidine kinase
MTLRLRSKFLLATLLISAGLTTGSLLLVRRIVQGEARRQIAGDLRVSVLTFQDVQRQREGMLKRSAELLADLPTIRALMTTHDRRTIQDASAESWRLSGSDLFVLADPSGQIMTFHTETKDVSLGIAERALARSLQEDAAHWWFGNGHLYQVFLQPIYFGPARENRVLGFLALGYEVDERLTQEISRTANSEVAFCYDHAIVRSTLGREQEKQLHLDMYPSSGRELNTREILLGNERYMTASVDLGSGSGNPRVELVVLKSFDKATGYLVQLNRRLVGLGIFAVLLGAVFVFFISRSFTRPLEGLVAGVRALEKGDFHYPLGTRSRDESAELTRSFLRMRNNLQKTQRELIEVERLATIGRMANSISHDLRHSLAAVLANAEFLCGSNLTPAQREDLYQEVRLGVNQMTDLVDSLLEFSRTRESLRPAFGSVQASLERAIQSVKAHPEYQRVRIETDYEGCVEAWFDPRKLERAFQNLLLNACEAVPRETGRVQVSVREAQGQLEIRVKDNGKGIPQEVRGRLFEPFVSFGKENGTGLGLTVVQKIMQDHGGDVVVESTSSEGTIFKLTLPLHAMPEPMAASPAGELQKSSAGGR